MRSEILVMGGTQFVSAAIASHLVENGHAVDILTRGNHPVPFQGFRQHIIGNRREEGVIKNAFQNAYDFVVDVSAYTKEDVSALLPHINLEKFKKYVFISSGAVYNRQLHGTSLSEDAPSEPIPHPTWGNYGLQKKQAENCVIEQAKGFAYVIVRPPYIYGPGNNLLRESFYFSRIEANKPILIPANTSTQIQFVIISDLCRFIEESLTNPNATDEVYNIAHPERITWRGLADSLLKVTEKKTKIYTVNTDIEPDARSYSPFRDENMILDISKLIAHGFSLPRVNFYPEGLTEAYSGYREERKKRSLDSFRDPKMTRLASITALMESNQS